VSLEEEPKATAIRCKSRRCSWCGRFLQLASYVVLADGIAKAQAEGCRVRFITLTDTAVGEGTVASFYSSWHRLTQRLKRRGKLGATARVLETTKRGKLHIHALLAENESGGGYIEQAELSKLAVASGFGIVTDIRLVGAVGEPRSLPAYLTEKVLVAEAKEVARYCTKQGADRLAELGGERVRPLNLSRDWLGGGIRDAERALMEHWYGRRENVAFEVWDERELQPQLRRLRSITAREEINVAAHRLLAA
jgi:hypothetical protein